MNEICSSKYIRPFISQFPDNRKVLVIKKLIKFGLQEISKYIDQTKINEHTISQYINHTHKPLNQISIIEDTVSQIKAQLNILEDTIQSKLKTPPKQKSKTKQIDVNSSYSAKRVVPQRLCTIIIR
jgi:hypothetical protein